MRRFDLGKEAASEIVSLKFDCPRRTLPGAPWNDGTISNRKQNGCLAV
jgi:hypothetical protein